MKYKECVMPERCSSCGSIFDMWRDLIAADNGNISGIDEFMCPKCREEESKNVKSIIDYSEIGVMKDEDYEIINTYGGEDETAISS